MTLALTGDCVAVPATKLKDGGIRQQGTIMKNQCVVSVSVRPASISTLSVNRQSPRCDNGSRSQAGVVATCTHWTGLG
jgi:hypothetical protein